MSNFLSRLVAKQMGSGEGSQSMGQSMIQPRPIARFESVVAPTATPVSPPSEAQNFINTTQPLTYPDHSRINSLSDLRDYYPQASPDDSNSRTETSLQPQGEFAPQLSTNLDAFSSAFTTTSGVSLLPLSPFPPTITSGSQSSSHQQPVHSAISQSSRSSSSITPSVAPVLPSTKVLPQSLAMPIPVSSLTASGDRPRFPDPIVQDQDRLPTSPLLIPPAPPQTFPPQTQPSEPASAAPTAAPAPTIQVTIGRIEVRATSPAVKSTPAPRPAARMSLEDYLQRRTQGRKP